MGVDTEDAGGVDEVTDAQITHLITELKLTLLERMHEIELAQGKTGGEVGTLASRFDSELGHVRRELGEVLRNTDEQRKKHSEIETRIRGLETTAATSANRLDAIASDAALTRTLTGDVALLKQKDDTRVETERNTKLTLRALIAAVLGGAAKVIWDTWSSR